MASQQTPRTCHTRTAEHRHQARPRSATSQLSPPFRTTSEEEVIPHTHTADRHDSSTRTSPRTSSWPPAVGPWHVEPETLDHLLPEPCSNCHHEGQARLHSWPVAGEPQPLGGVGWGLKRAGHLPSRGDQVSSSPFVLALCHPLPPHPILDLRIPPQLGGPLNADLQHLRLKFRTNLILTLLLHLCQVTSTVSEHLQGLGN